MFGVLIFLLFISDGEKRERVAGEGHEGRLLWRLRKQFLADLGGRNDC
jgi:hypothetical protein